MERRRDWRAWLERHHAESPGVWLVTWRKGSGGAVPAYDDAVEEALCFGWVDSKAGRVDEPPHAPAAHPSQAGQRLVAAQ